MKTKLLLILSCILCLYGCGGEMREDFVQAYTPAIDSDLSGPRKYIHIQKVRNNTGEKKYDDVCHYTHIKLAQHLSDTGKFNVVTNDLLSQQKIFLTAHEAKPEVSISLSLDHITEHSGGTFRVAIFSTQSKNVEVELSAKVMTLAGKVLTLEEVAGASSFGAWGVLMQVDRKKMLEEEEFWEFDNSMLGIAITKALQKLTF